MPKSWTCEICEKPVSEIGAYCKISMNKYAHLSCWAKQEEDRGIKLGREQILQEQETEKAFWAAEKEQQAKAAFEALPRCLRCGRKMGEVKYGNHEVVQPSASTTGVCAPCVREEAQARAQGRGQAPTGTQAIQTAATRLPDAKPEVKPQEPPKDRFELIEIDDEKA